MFGFNDREKRAAEFTTRGQKLAEKKEWKSALVEFDRAVALDPNRADLCSLRGIARRSAGDLEGSVEDLTASLALAKPTYMRLLHRGLAHHDLRNYAKAVADLNAASRLGAGRPTLYHTRAYAYRAMGRHDMAVADFEEFTRLSPQSVRHYYDWAQSLNELGDVEAAIEKAQRALELNPQFKPAKILLAGLYCAIGEAVHAIELLSEMIAGCDNPELLSHWVASRGAIYRSIDDAKRAAEDEARFKELHKECVRKIVARGGTVVLGALIQANSELFKPGLFDRMCLLAISFDAQANREPEKMVAIAQNLFSLKGTEQSDPQLSFAATLTTNEFGGDRRFLIPGRLTGGWPVYAAGLAVRRALLKDGVLNMPFIPCIATPGDTGSIEMLPLELGMKRLQKP